MGAAAGSVTAAPGGAVAGGAVPGGAAPVLATRGLTVAYGRFVAVDGLDVEVPPGVVGLVGANGAGKSTLLKVLLGLLAPSAGSAQVLGLDATADGERVRELVGYMPEHDCLPPDVSATAFVVQMARLSGLPRSAARERAADVLRHVGLYEERYRPMGGYSTGMRQRVKLAQALVHDPRLVLLDEPTNGLDPGGRDEMLGLVRRIGTEFGISVVVTSHLLGELERVCDTVVVLDGGRLLRATTTADLTGHEAVLVVEVDAEGDRLAALPRAAGLAVRAAGRTLEVDLRDGSPRHAGPSGPDDPDGRLSPSDPAAAAAVASDAVRDAAADLGVGLLRLERRRHRMAELFATAGGAR